MTTLLLAGDFADARPADESLPEAVRAELPDYQVLLADWRATAARRGSNSIRALRDIRRTLRFVDALVLGGPLDGLIDIGAPGRPGRGSLQLPVWLAAAARAAGVPVAIVGASVGDVTDNRSARAIRRLARLAGLFMVRDRHSAQVLMSAGVPAPVRIGPDPGWALVTKPAGRRGTASRRGTQARVVVAGTRVLHTAEPATLAAALRPAVDRGLRVQLQPWEHDSTTRAALSAPQTLSARLNADVEWLATPHRLVDGTDVLADSELAIATSHGAVLAAAAAGVRSLALSPDPVPVAVAADLGMPALRLPAAPGDVAAAVNRALDGPAVGAETVARRIEGARAALRLLRVVASRGRDEEPTGIAGLHLEPHP